MTQLLALYRVSLRTVATRGRVVGFAVLGVIGVLVAWQVSTAPMDRPWVTAARFADVFGFTLLAPIAALVFGSAALGDLVEDGTLVYLWARPVRRVKIALGAFAGAATYTVPIAAVPTVFAVAVISSDRRVLVATLVSITLAALVYTALFVFVGLMTTRALVWGIGYLLIIEGFVARGGRSLGFVAVHSHAVSLLGRWGGVRMRFGYFSWPTSLITLLVVAAAALALTLRRLDRAEIA